MEPVECVVNLEKHIADIVRYSGRFIFRLGKYHECVATEGLDYFFIQAGAKGTPDQSVFLGVCLPSACSNTTVRALINEALSIVQLPLEAKSVQVHLEDFKYPFTWPFFLTFTILVVLAALVLVATLSSKSRENKILSGFSIQETTKMFKYQHEGSRLNVLNGIRSLSMLWVIYGHAMSSYVGYSSNINTVEQNVLSDWRFLTVSSGLYSVDAFFFVGGFLLAYAFLKQKISSKLKYLLAALNRLLRLLPSYLVAMMIYYTIFPHLGSGPFWQNQVDLSNLCHSMWRPLLFVDNIVDNGDNMCMPWGWYLQNDIQLFFYCLIILVIYRKSRFWSFFAIFISIAANFWYVMEETYDNGEKWLSHISDAAQSQRYQLNIYYKPWGRCPPYLYGLLLGLLYYEFLQYEKNSNQMKKLKEGENLQNQIPEKPMLFQIKEKFEEKVWVRRSVELSGVILCLFLTFIPRTNQGSHYWPQLVHSLYLTYGKLAFVFGLSLIILPSIILNSDTKDHKNQKLLVRFLMDTKTFNFIAKVSFCTYLLHLAFILVYYGSTKSDFYYAFYPVLVLFVSFSVISIISGTVLVYMVEAPFAKLQKELIKRISPKNRTQKKKDQNSSEAKSSQNISEQKQKSEPININESIVRYQMKIEN